MGARGGHAEGEPFEDMFALILSRRLHNASLSEQVFVHSDIRLKGIALPPETRPRFLQAFAMDIFHYKKRFRVQERLSSKFAFFVEVRTDAIFDKASISRLVFQVTKTLRHFYDGMERVLVLYADGKKAATRMRIIFPDIVVDTERALILHQNIKNNLFRVLKGANRLALSNCLNFSEEPVMKPKWHETLPNNLYEIHSEILTLGSYTFEKCPGESGSSSHKLCSMCQGAKNVQSSEKPLSFKIIFAINREGELELHKESCMQPGEEQRTAYTRWLDLSLLRREAGVPLTPWDPPKTAATAPRKRKADGTIVSTHAFNAETSGHSQNNRMTLVNARVLGALTKAIRDHHTQYRFLSIASAFVTYTKQRRDPYERPEYDINVWGPGETYCCNIRACHHCREDRTEARGRAKQLGSGRIWFKVTSKGMRQLCYNRDPVDPPKRACKDYFQNFRPLDEATKREIGFGMDLPCVAGPAMHRLTWDILPALYNQIESIQGQGRGRGRGGR